MNTPRGERIVDEQELLRQIRPEWLHDGRPSSQNFQPMPKDHGLLSVSASTLTTAAASFEHFVGHGGASCGVMAVTVSECAELGLPAHHDPIPAGERFGPDPAHSIVDFRTFGDRQTRKLAKSLRAMAVARGWAYQPSAGPGGTSPLA